MDNRPRIALLIDADNAPAAKIELILNELSRFGETSIRRAYGNWTKSELNGWAQVLHGQAIKPVQQYDYSRGKNASDMAMVVDAMALLYTDRPDAFGIVSSDADFTPLVMHLREKGAAVYGFGQQKTPAPFVSACSKFLFLDQLGVNDVDDSDETDQAANRDEPAAAKAARPVRVPTARLKRDSALVNLLRNAVQGSADEEGWALVGTVGQHISNQSSFDPRNYGYPTLTKLLVATDLFEMANEGTGAVAVRDARKRQSTKS